MIEFQLLKTSGPSFITRCLYRITQNVVKKAVKLDILFMVWRLAGSWKPVLQHVPCHISRILPERMWRQTSHMAGECVPTGPGHPLCRRLATNQRSRRLAEVRWQVMAQAFNWCGRVGGSASLSQMCGLQTCLLADADPQESWDLPSNTDSSFTKMRGRYL